MKIISWNVNGLQARLEGVNRLVEKYKPDLMCFQKVRKKGAFLTQIPGYMGWLGIMDDGLYGGVSTYIRQAFPFEFEAQRNDMPEWLMNTGCLNVIRFDQFILVNTYFPYSNTADEKWLQIRRHWDYELHDYLMKLYNENTLIVCGDMNIVATDKDAWDGVSVKNAGCYFPWEHKNFDGMMRAAGLVDSYRVLNPNGTDFSYFYQNKQEYRLLNQGFRIDYCLVSEDLLQCLIKSEILTDVTETTNSPLLIEIDFPNIFSNG